MAKILSIKSRHLPPNIEKEAEKENFFKELWDQFWHLDNFTKAFIVFVLLFIIAVPIIKTQYFDIRQRAQTEGINITIDLSTPDGVSQFSTGTTHTQYSADSWNNTTAVASARQLLSGSTSFQNQHIMGWGALNPWPDSSITDPAKWNWESLDGRINLIRQTGGIPIITLCCSPDWMKGGVNGQTDWSKLEVAPLPEHEADFANLAKQVALRYPDVKYFQVWNELKGMWDSGQNRWDYERYTRLYNLVYDAIKSVRTDANIGGPYVVMDSWSNASQSNPSTVSGPYGVLDQRPMDVIKYWLQNKHGADFITVDGGPRPKDGNWVTDEFTAGQYFTDTVSWIRSLDNTAYPGAKTLPIWWAEWYANSPNSGVDINHDTAVMASDLIYTIKSGASLPLILEPQGDANGFSYPVGIWTDTRITGGGQATPFYNVQKYFHDYFPLGTQFYKVSSPSNDIGVLASKLKTLLVNRKSNLQTVVVNGVTFTLGAYQVIIIDTPTPIADSGFSPNVITDPSLVLTIPSVPKPAYLSPITPGPFNLPVIRIGGNAGATFTALNGTGTWGTDVRQHYNDDQAWNADQSLIALQNGGTGASPSQVYLDGDTYQPKYIKCSNYSNYDDRWHPSVAHKNERINVRGSSAILEWFNIVNCAQTRVWNLPFVAASDLAQNPSADGRFIAVWSTSLGKVVIVDMDPQSPLASYDSGNKRIGPVYDLVTNCGLATCTADHLYISPSGKYLEVTYEGDHPRIFDVNPDTLAITPHAMPSNSPECSGQDPAKGYVFDLGHEAAEANPFDNNEEVLIGQLRGWCPKTVTNSDGTSVSLGQTVMVRMKDNYVTTLTTPGNEAYSYHNSALNYWNRPGWVYVSHWPGSGTRFNDEIIAIKLDGSKSVQRFVHDHTDTNSCYRCEAHPVPSRDGKRIIFASSWTLNCGTGCGSQSNPQAYVVDARDTTSPSPIVTPTPTIAPTLTPTPTSRPTPTKIPSPTNTPTPTPTVIVVTQPILPTNTPTPTTNAGFIGSYFDNKDFTNLKFTRIDPVINFNWGKSSPGSLIGNDTFSINWNAYIVPPENNIYTFYEYSDDGARVWVNNQLIIDKWFDHSAKEYGGNIILNGGQVYSIKVAYYENKGSAAMKLFWSSPNLPKQILGQPYLR